jgi:ABC-type antimicrobial peptide transport system permease subunit
MNLETYRELKNNPANGSPNLDESLLTKLMATAQAEVDETTLVSSLRDYLVNNNSLSVTATSESVAQNRSQLQQTRIFTVLLTGLSMVTAIFGVLAVMYTAVMSRRVEIGMLKAVGASKGALRGVFIGEAIITTLAAGIAGIVAGTLLGYAFEGSQRLQQDQLILLAFDFRTAGIIVALVCLAALFSSILATQPVIKQKAIKILRER